MQQEACIAPNFSIIRKNPLNSSAHNFSLNLNGEYIRSSSEKWCFILYKSITHAASQRHSLFAHTAGENSTLLYTRQIGFRREQNIVAFRKEFGGHGDDAIAVRQLVYEKGEEAER